MHRCWADSAGFRAAINWHNAHKGQVSLTTALTTERLDVHGRLWTMRRAQSWNKGQVGQPWTARRVLHNRRALVRFLSHLPSPSIACHPFRWGARTVLYPPDADPISILAKPSSRDRRPA